MKKSLFRVELDSKCGYCKRTERYRAGLIEGKRVFYIACKDGDPRAPKIYEKLDIRASTFKGS